MSVSDLDLRTLVLVAHIASGTVALALAAAVMAAGSRQNWTSRLGHGYVAAVCLVAATALALVATGSTLPSGVRALLAVVAVLTAVAAVAGLRLALRRVPAVTHRAAHLRLMWGSVTSLVSAVAIVSAPAPVWIAVVIAGTVFTEHSYQRVRRAQSWVTTTPSRAAWEHQPPTPAD